MQRCQQCCLASRTPFRLHFVVHAWRRIGVGQVQWIGFRSMMYWFGYGSLRISPLLLQASSKMPEIGVPAMPADAVPMGWTSVFYLFCCHRFCLVFWQSLHNKYQSFNGEEWKEKKGKTNDLLNWGEISVSYRCLISFSSCLLLPMFATIRKYLPTCSVERPVNRFGRRYVAPDFLEWFSWTCHAPS